MNFHLRNFSKEYDFVYKFQDVTALLKAYSSFVSLAAISRETGINSALLSHYANGLKVPRQKQQKKDNCCRIAQNRSVVE